MLAILAAAAVATALSATDRTVASDAFERTETQRFVAINPSVFRALQGERLCKGAGRMQTSLAEPALLFRPQDRDAARTRRLIDLPPAEACLVGRTPTMGAGR